MKNKRFILLLAWLPLIASSSAQNFITEYRLIAERNDYYNPPIGSMEPGDSINYFYTGESDTIIPYKPVNFQESGIDEDTIVETELACDSAWIFYYYPDEATWKLQWKSFKSYELNLPIKDNYFYCPLGDCEFNTQYFFSYNASGQLDTYYEFAQSPYDTAYKISYIYENGLLVKATHYYEYNVDLGVSLIFEYTYDDAGMKTSKKVYKHDWASNEPEIFSTEDFFYNDLNQLIEYNYYEVDYTGTMFPRFNIYYTYQQNKVSEKIYENYNSYYDEWTYSEKYIYYYEGGLTSTVNEFIFYPDSTWYLNKTENYTYENGLLVKIKSNTETTDFIYNDQHNLILELNYDDTTFDASNIGYKKTYKYDEHGNMIYYENGDLFWSYTAWRKSYYYYESYKNYIGGTATSTIYIHVYPSPADNYFSIEINNILFSSTITTQIFNVQGNVVFSSKESANNAIQKTVDCSGFAAGVYVVSVHDGENTSWQKVVVK
ncbi:MAG: T9SS type A sorting domain-containing protein [Chitinophagales bacterium]